MSANASLFVTLIPPLSDVLCSSWHREKKITKVQDLASMISRLQMDIAAAEKYRDEIREIRRNAQKA